MFKTEANIHSRKGTITPTDIVTIVSERSNNDVVAEYKGAYYTAVFNPHVGMYYIDDIYGCLPNPMPSLNFKACKGMRFREWCELDANDTRKIVYVKTPYGQFTSEDRVDYKVMEGIRLCYVKNVDFVDDVWYIHLVKTKSAAMR